MKYTLLLFVCTALYGSMYSLGYVILEVLQVQNLLSDTGTWHVPSTSVKRNRLHITPWKDSTEPLGPILKASCTRIDYSTTNTIGCRHKSTRFFRKSSRRDGSNPPPPPPILLLCTRNRCSSLCTTKGRNFCTQNIKTRKTRAPRIFVCTTCPTANSCHKLGSSCMTAISS